MIAVVQGRRPQHGDVQTAGGAAAGLVGTHGGDAAVARASVLQQAQSAAGPARLRPLRRGALPEVLPRTLGRPSIPPGVYFRMLLVGYFEGIDSRAGDRLAVCRFAGRCGSSWATRSTDGTPDHSSLSVIRRRIDLETHEAVFDWVLKVLAERRAAERQDAGHGRHDAGGQRGDAEHRAQRHGARATRSS